MMAVAAHIHFVISHLPASDNKDQSARSQPDVSVTTEDVLGCLGSSHSHLTLEADVVWFSLVYTGNTSGSPRVHVPSTCRLQVTGRGKGVMSLLVFNMTCSTSNKFVLISDEQDTGSLDCDPFAWLAPGQEIAMMSIDVNVSIEISDVGTPFSVHAQFKTVAERQNNTLEKRNVTQYLGMTLRPFFLYVTFTA